MILAFLTALVLFLLAVCAPALVSVMAAVVVAGTVAAIAPVCSKRSVCTVAARSAGDAARWDQGEDAGCAGGGAGRMVVDLPDATIVQVRAGGFPINLTVAILCPEEPPGKFSPENTTEDSAVRFAVSCLLRWSILPCWSISAVRRTFSMLGLPADLPLSDPLPPMPPLVVTPRHRCGGRLPVLGFNSPGGQAIGLR